MKEKCSGLSWRNSIPAVRVQAAQGGAGSFPLAGLPAFLFRHRSQMTPDGFPVPGADGFPGGVDQIRLAGEQPAPKKFGVLCVNHGQYRSIPTEV
jgi:hypothetical protein